MIETLDYLAKCSFSDNFDELESIWNVVTLLNSIITFFIIETIIDQPLQFGGLDLIFVFAHVIYLVEFVYFSFLEICQVFISNYLLLCKCWGYRIFNFLFRKIIGCQLISFWGFRNDWIYSLNHLAATRIHTKGITWWIIIVRLRKEVFTRVVHPAIQPTIVWFLATSLILSSSVTSLSLWWCYFQLLLTHAWPRRSTEIICLYSSLIITFSIQVLLTLNTSRHSHLACRLIDYICNTSFLGHLLFVFVEDMCLIIFIALFEHQLLGLAWWNLLWCILVVLDEHCRVDVVIVSKIRST